METQPVLCCVSLPSDRTGGVESTRSLCVVLKTPLLSCGRSRCSKRYALSKKRCIVASSPEGSAKKTLSGLSQCRDRGFVSPGLPRCLCPQVGAISTHRGRPRGSSHGQRNRRTLEFRGNLVSTSQSLAFFTGRNRCPGQRCPTIEDLTTPRGKRQLAACLEAIDRECQGGASIPHILSKSRSHGLGDRKQHRSRFLYRAF